MVMSTQPTTPTTGGDPLLERLERLAQRRTPTPSGPPTMVAGSTQQAKRTKRHHPAKVARMGALAISCVTTGGLAYLFAGINESQATAQSLAALPTPISTGTETAASTTTVARSSTTSTTTGASTVQAFDGDVVNTRYGPVQVQVQISAGAITEVAVVQYPNGDGKSVRINANALPTLRSEALTAQSANIDTVSGATYTSNAYAVSLQAAIDQARVAGATTLA
jgi:uncharacterized protein with FMN-binding domain